MHAREIEPSLSVIEASSIPGTRTMALLAGLREPRGHVVWFFGSLVILEVATRASSVRDVVVVVDVAVGTLSGRHGVHAG